jgi:hypothetical protein
LRNLEGEEKVKSNADPQNNGDAAAVSSFKDDELYKSRGEINQSGRSLAAFRCQ